MSSLTPSPRIALIGAGALGLMYGQALYDCYGDSVCFVSDSHRVDADLAKVWSVNGEVISLPVETPESFGSAADLVIVAVKNQHLEAVLPVVKAVSAPGTVVISVLNGIDSEVTLAQAIPESKVLLCVVLGMDAVREGSSVWYTVRGKFVMGTAANDPRDPQLLQAARWLRDAGLACEIPADIHREMWRKLMINIGANQVSAMTGATYGVLQISAEARELMAAAMEETVAVAQAEGIALDHRDVDAWFPVLNSLGAQGKTSMLQDIEAGRETEVNWFAGKLVALADRHGISVPVNQTLFRLIKLRESAKNCAKLALT